MMYQSFVELFRLKQTFFFSSCFVTGYVGFDDFSNFVVAKFTCSSVFTGTNRIPILN